MLESEFFKRSRPDFRKIEAFGFRRGNGSFQYSEELPGGNHAQFGDYGPQKGDGAAALSRGEQTAWAADRIERLIFGE